MGVLFVFRFQQVVIIKTGNRGKKVNLLPAWVMDLLP